MYLLANGGNGRCDLKAQYSAGFERFWKLYPRKKVKHAAWLVWKRTVKPLFEQEVIDALQAQVDSKMFSDDDKYIPHGRTWLYQRRWDDEIKKPSTSAGQAAPEPGKYDGLF